MDGEKIYTESVEKEKLLFAREDKYVNNEVDGEKVAEGILITVNVCIGNICLI